MKFIKLTDEEGDIHYINPNHIVKIANRYYRDEDIISTVIHLQGSGIVVTDLKAEELVKQIAPNPSHLQVIK
jgi:hypothetical protein